MSCLEIGDSLGCQAIIDGACSYQLLNFLCQIDSPCDAPLSRLNGLYNTNLTRVHVDQINFVDLAVVNNIELFVCDDFHGVFFDG